MYVSVVILSFVRTLLHFFW